MSPHEKTFGVAPGLPYDDLSPIAGELDDAWDRSDVRPTDAIKRYSGMVVRHPSRSGDAVLLKKPPMAGKLKPK
ncbi:hypothetical protein RI367_007302 [Sorochytrium milnesiophthora]